MARKRGNQRGLLWAAFGGVILLAGIITIIVAAVLNQPSIEPSPTSPAPRPSTSTTPPTPGDDVVDASVADQGWAPEPVTTDPELYIRRALEAASTFDTQLSDRDAWLTHLDSWFTPDTRYSSPDDQQEEKEAAQLELRQSVVLPEPDWDSLANEDGRVAAAIAGEIDYVEVPEDASGDMRIGTADGVC